MLRECIEIKKNNPDFSAFAEALTISNATPYSLNNIVSISGGTLYATNGIILKTQELQNIYHVGCYEKIFRSNSKIFLASSPEQVKYPNFKNILDMDGYRNIFEFESSDSPALEFFKLVRLTEKINIDFKYFSMLRGQFSTWFKDEKSVIIFKSPDDNVIFAVMPLTMEV